MIANREIFTRSRIVRLLRELQSCQLPDDAVVIKSQKRRKVRVTGDERAHSRGADYIGVSRNGRKFQALIMEGLKKRYLCLLDAPEEAAHSYDKHAMVLHGLKVSTCIGQPCRQRRISSTRKNKFTLSLKRNF